VLRRRSTSLWLSAVLFYGFGDTVTTLIGLNTVHVEETSPIVSRFVEYGGIGGLFAVKFLTLAAFYLAWRYLPFPGRVGIPVALSLVGIVVTVWNLLMLLPPGTFP
jgi:hypothetical protein